MSNTEKFVEVFGTDLKRQYSTKSWWDQEFVPKNQNKWIPVSERLPEFTINKLVVGTHFTEDVLVYDGADFRVGYFARKDKLDCNYWVVYGEDYFEPIAWMPIEPYRASPTGAEKEG